MDQNPSAQGPEKSGNPPRVLILEDEEMLRELIRIALEMLGCEVAEAADGRTALQSHRLASDAGTPFSLLISDLSLPGDLSAVETLRQMLETTPGLRALLCTGNTESDVFRNFRNHGFCGRIPKPFEVADLFKTIQSHLPETPRQSPH